jgi:hypothetical protein
LLREKIQPPLTLEAVFSAANDGQSRFQGLQRVIREQPKEDFVDFYFGSSRDAQDNDPGMVGRRVLKDVTEVFVIGKQTQ